MTRSPPVLSALAALGVALIATAGAACAQELRGTDDATTLRGGVEEDDERGAGGALRGSVTGIVDTGSTAGQGLSSEGAGALDVLPTIEQPLDALSLPDGGLNLSTAPLRKRRLVASEDDPFAPVGLRVGTFVVTPYVEMRGGYDGNALRVPNGAGSSFAEVGGGLAARSDWSRHALDIELRGGYTRFYDVEGNNRPEAEGTIRSRIDVNSLTRIDTVVRGAITTDAAGSVDAVAGAKNPPLVYESGIDLGLTRRFNRFEATVAGIIEREDHAPAELTDGTTESLTDQNVTGYGVRLRGAYELMPGVKPFAQVVADHRVYDVVPDASGFNRDSKGITAMVGSDFRLTGLLTGTASVGYTWRDYVDPQLEDIGGLVADASLRWEATGLTTVEFGARSAIAETTYADASGDFIHEVRVEVEHAFRRWLIGTASVAYRIDDYEGSGLTQRTFTVGAGLVYKINRYAELTGNVSHLRLNSTVPGDDYTANVVTVGLRLQR
ncbi:MAG: hypothetical protein K0R27_2445 [Xanthobacteraceae bacterium]|nr:hypothetical protein [Xanthobacteraceae bacterium]